MKFKLGTSDTSFTYQDGNWTLTEGRYTLTKKKSASGYVLPGTRMDIVPVGKAFLVGLQIANALTGEIIAVIPIARGEQASALAVASDWNMRSKQG